MAVVLWYVFVVVEGMDIKDQGGSNMCQLNQAQLDVWTAALNLPGFEVVQGYLG